MTKMIVETKGAYQLSGSLFDGSDRVPFDRPAVVTKTSYIELKVASDVSGLLVHADNLPDTANDADFLATLTECEGDAEAAVEIYLSELEGIEDQKETPAERKKRLAEEKKKAEPEQKPGKEGFTAADAAPKPEPGKLTPNPATDPELQKG